MGMQMHIAGPPTSTAAEVSDKEDFHLDAHTHHILKCTEGTVYMLEPSKSHTCALLLHSLRSNASWLLDTWKYINSLCACMLTGVSTLRSISRVLHVSDQWLEQAIFQIWQR